MKRKSGLGYIPPRKIVATLMVTGHPDQVCPTIFKMVDKLIKRFGTDFKIGKTGRENRGQDKTYKNFNHMIYLYATTSEDRVSNVEAAVNKYCKGKYPKRIKNDKEGSASKTSAKSLNKRVYIAFE